VAPSLSALAIMSAPISGTVPALVLGALGGGGDRAGRLYSKRPDLLTRIFGRAFLRHFWWALPGARPRRGLGALKMGAVPGHGPSANWLHVTRQPNRRPVDCSIASF
jgi:hypothetical protein